MTTVFLDRDGVINEDRHGGIRSWEQFRFVPGALDAVRRLGDAGHQVVIVTNQSAIGRGLATRAAIDNIHSRMLGEMVSRGGRIAGLFMCPHSPQLGCGCRKPQPGLLFKARDELGVDLGSSIFIGDHVTDLQAGLAAGCKSVILVLTGRGLAALRHPILAQAPNLLVASDLAHATRLVARDPLPMGKIGWLQRK